MIPALIAATCGFLFSPPASWDARPLPAGTQVVEVPLILLRTSVYCWPSTTLFGCEREEDGHPVVYIPTWASWRKSLFCYDEDVRHELDHARGWTHP